MEKQIVAKLIEEIAANFKVEAKAQFIDYREGQLERHHVGDGKYLIPFPKCSNDWKQKTAQQRRSDIAKFITSTEEKLQASPVDLGYEYRVDSWSGMTVYVLRSNYKQLLEEEAVKYAETVVNDWCYKQIEKYNEVVESKKGVNGTVKKIGSLSHNQIRFSWEDGSGFTVQNQITHGYSNLGTYFNRFPTTFHDVTLVGGEKMKQPSEAKVKKAFVNKDVKPVNAPAVHWAVNGYRAKHKVSACCVGNMNSEYRSLSHYMNEDKSKVTCKRCLKAIERAEARANKN